MQRQRNLFDTEPVKWLPGMMVKEHESGYCEIVYYVKKDYGDEVSVYTYGKPHKRNKKDLFLYAPCKDHFPLKLESCEQCQLFNIGEGETYV